MSEDPIQTCVSLHHSTTTLSQYLGEGMLEAAQLFTTLCYRSVSPPTQGNCTVYRILQDICKQWLVTGSWDTIEGVWLL